MCEYAYENICDILYCNNRKQMNPFQYLFYKIYKTCRNIDKAIHSWRGPRYYAALITSLLICSPLFLITYETGVWKDSGSMIWQFVSGFVLLSIIGGLSVYFDNTKTFNIIHHKFSAESKAKSLLGSLIINLLIIAYVVFLFKRVMDGN